MRFHTFPLCGGNPLAESGGVEVFVHGSRFLLMSLTLSSYYKKLPDNVHSRKNDLSDDQGQHPVVLDVQNGIVLRTEPSILAEEEDELEDRRNVDREPEEALKDKADQKTDLLRLCSDSVFLHDSSTKRLYEGEEQEVQSSNYEPSCEAYIEPVCDIAAVRY